jgi:hypothetical protein
MTLRTNATGLVRKTLTGTITHPRLGALPYRIGTDGRPYVPTGEGGIAYGIGPGSPVFGWAADHLEPGATIAHPDHRANTALSAFSCLGNEAWADVGGEIAAGTVVGSRGEAGGVFVWFPEDVLRKLAPGDRVTVRAVGVGLSFLDYPEVVVHRLDPRLVSEIVAAEGDALVARVKAVVPPWLLGNGVGRPAATWEVDIQSDDVDEIRRHGLTDLCIGDVVALTDWEAITVHGRRPGAVTIGVVVHGDSPQPGHGPGIQPVLSDRQGQLRFTVDPACPHLFGAIASGSQVR